MSSMWEVHRQRMLWSIGESSPGPVAFSAFIIRDPKGFPSPATIRPEASTFPSSLVSGPSPPHPPMSGAGGRRRSQGSSSPSCHTELQTERLPRNTATTWPRRGTRSRMKGAILWMSSAGTHLHSSPRASPLPLLLPYIKSPLTAGFALNIVTTRDE